MGVDFTALCDHKLSWDELYALPGRLNASWALPQPLSAFVGKHVRAGPPRWEWLRDPTYSNVAEELFEAGHVALDGPHGFGGTVYRCAMEISHLARWWRFLCERDLQLGLQQASRLIARSIGATRILYLPDSAFPPSSAGEALHDGASFDSVLSWLRAEVGAPFAQPEDFLGRDNDDWDERGWFFEPVAV